VAEQLNLDPGRLAEYGQRRKTAYEHAWQIRELLGYRDFGADEAEIREFVAARVWASAMQVLMAAPEATEERLVSLVEVWKAIEEVVPREKLAAAVVTVAAFVPVADDDAAAEWRAELVKRYRTVQGFIEPLLATIRFRAVEAGAPVLAMVRAAAAMAKSRRRHGPADIAAHEHLISGSWGGRGGRHTGPPPRR
jgi:hypothetical protein